MIEKMWSHMGLEPRTPLGHKALTTDIVKLLSPITPLIFYNTCYKNTYLSKSLS